MQSKSSLINHWSVIPLGAGDLIDRTIRLYRRHFMALIRASAPPVLVSSVGAVLWTIGIRETALTDSSNRLFIYVGLAVIGVVLLMMGYLLNLIVMGGASRNLVTHLLWNEPVSARTIYRNVRARFWGLLGASLAIGFCALIAGGVALVAWYIVLVLGMISVFVGARFSGAGAGAWLMIVVVVILMTVASLGALWLFFLLAGRVAYVPQVMLIEGRGVFASISRSASLARGNARRLMAMFLFTTFATYAALMLLMIPLGWYGYLNGVNPFSLNAVEQPVWYAIGSQVVGQSSAILLTPVWMLGLSLLYVDERVRHEGYDIELMAARIFGEIPALPTGKLGPLSPAVASGRVAEPTGPLPQELTEVPQESWSNTSTLGLK